jgi:HEAT repeat protein
MRTLYFLVIFASVCFLGGCDPGWRVMEGGGNVARLREQAVEIIRESLDDENGLIRSNAIEVVAETGQKELMDKVKQLLGDDFVGIRFTAAVAVGDVKYVSAKRSVQRLLRDKNENAKIAAAYALVRFGNAEYARFIRQAIKRKAVSKEDQTIRANAALLLGKLGDQDDLELLYEAMHDDYSSDKVRIQAVESIATLGDEKIYRMKLWALLISKYADDKIMGIRAMAALGLTGKDIYYDVKNAIATMLDDDIVEVRLVAAEQLGRLGERIGEGVVLEYFTKVSARLDRNSIDRGNVLAAMAIGRIGGDNLTRFLPELLKSPSKTVRLSAARAVLLLTRQPRNPSKRIGNLCDSLLNMS